MNAHECVPFLTVDDFWLARCGWCGRFVKKELLAETQRKQVRQSHLNNVERVLKFYHPEFDRPQSEWAHLVG